MDETVEDTRPVETTPDIPPPVPVLERQDAVDTKDVPKKKKY